MAIPFFIEKRKVIPNWRSFKATVALGELSVNEKFDYNNEGIDLLNEKISQWKAEASIINAAELLNAAIVLRLFENNEIKNAAEFIVENPRSSSISLLSLANKFRTEGNETRELTVNTLEAFEEFEAIQQKQVLYHKINSLKKKIRDFPRNPIFWVELSRFYSILGQFEEAKRAIRIANNLAPDNRFILRSLSRLFVHSQNYDIAHDFLRKSSIVKTDPWITSAEIAIASLRGRSSKFLGKGLEMIGSKKFAKFSVTELNSSIATLELENGSIKKAREFFRQSLMAPNDNALAQAEWANQEERKLDIIIPKNLFTLSYEAQAYECYDKSDWKGVIENCLRWFIDMPQSETSMLLAFHVVTIFQKDYEMAVKFCNAALISHPNDPTLLNNRAYALALLRRTTEALEDVEKGQSNLSATKLEQICLKATRGLIHFRENNIVEGRELYLDAMIAAKKINEPYYFNMAFLNFAREELLLGTADSDKIIKQVEKLAIDSDYKDLLFIKEEVLKLKNKKGVSALFYKGIKDISSGR